MELRITNIAKHPGFDASQGPIGGNDIAVFKTADKVGDRRRLKSACLPPQNRERPTFGIHSGWATAPEFQWLEKNVPTLLRYYSNFFKQWHYKVDIHSKCHDATFSPVLRSPHVFQSNSYYPPGTLCANDIFRMACFSTG